MNPKYGEVYRDPADGEVVMVVGPVSSGTGQKVLVFVESNRRGTNSEVLVLVERHVNIPWERVDDPA